MNDPEQLWDETPEHDGEHCECHECTSGRVKMTTTKDDHDALIDGLLKQHREHNGWVFTYEYPGVFTYSKGRESICFSPDWEEQDVVAVQIMNDEGEYLGGDDFPFKDRNVESLFQIVKPYLI